MPELLALIFRRCWNQHPWNQHPWNFSASGFLYVLLTPSWVQWELWGFSAPCSSLRTHRGVSQEGNIQLPKALGFSGREYRSAGEDHFCPIHPGLDIPKSKQGSFHLVLLWDRDFPANPLFCLLPRFPLFNSRLVNLGKENNTNHRSSLTGALLSYKHTRLCWE